MVLSVILIVLASLGAVATYYFGGFTNSIQWIWLPFVLGFAYFWGLFLLHAIYMAIFAFFVNHSKKTDYKPNRYGMWMLGQTCYVLFWLFRVRLHATGLGKVPGPERKFMLVSNHLSGFDHVGLISLFVRHRMICVSKKENLDVILAGGWIRYSGYIAIDQTDVVSGTKAMALAGSYIAEDVCSVAIAPEGTRNKNFPDPELLPFHPGSFQMAYASQCPIVVFAIQNTNAILRRFPLRPTDVYFDCVGVLEYEEYKDLSPHDVAELTRGMIAKRFEKKGARFYHLKPKKKKEEAAK